MPVDQDVFLINQKFICSIVESVTLDTCDTRYRPHFIVPDKLFCVGICEIFKFILVKYNQQTSVHFHELQCVTWFKSPAEDFTDVIEIYIRPIEPITKCTIVYISGWI